MKPLRLALIRQRYTPFGGAERFVARAMEALGGQNAEITIVTRQWDAPNGHSLICNPFYLGNVWRDRSFARCVCQRLGDKRFDLVQSHERLPCCDIYRAGDGVHREWLAQRRRTLGFWQRLGLALNPYHRYTLKAERRLFASARLKAVICNSRMVRDEIRHHFDLPENRLHVIYNGVDTAAFHPSLRSLHRATVRARLSIPETVPTFLFVGSGFERKGLAAALQAIARLPSARLLVVGHDRHMDRYRELAQRLGVQERVDFLGPQQDVQPYYGAADAFVLPTLYDPFPNAALEAMASGLPLITSSKSGAGEFVRPGENGFVCDALDVNALTDAMGRLLPQDQAARMGAAARTAAEALTLEHLSQQLLALYESLLDSEAGRAIRV